MAFRVGFVLLLVFLPFGRVDSDDGETLLEIKKSFRDVDNVLYDWTDSPSSDYCVWRGITCDNVTFSVLTLNLSSLNLDGEISPAIGNLKSVQNIELKGNRLSGQIPDEIGDCSSLINLDLSFNELSGDIPFSISKLKQLVFLILKNNKLIGPIPSTLSQIPNLKIFGLRGNNLVGTLSPDICQLTGLWYFDVRNNSLTGSIPPNIGNCTAFQVLDLSYNQLTGEIPFNIGFLQVATLYVLVVFVSSFVLDNVVISTRFEMGIFVCRSLQGNRLSGHIPSVIGLMQALAVLYLHSNKLTGSIPPELGNMTKLHYLELNDNHLSGRIPPELGKLTNLFDLNVHGNKLNGTISTAFQRLESMTYLDLSSNSLAGSIPPELGQLQNLFSLRLEHNNISGDLMSLLNCLSLTLLNVSYNNLAGNIPTNNNFSKFSPDSFIGNPRLCGYWLSSSCHVPHPTERVTISKAAILGIALGALVILLMILVAACRPHNQVPFPDGSLDKPAVYYSTPKLVILHMNMALHVYEDIMRMTENLSEKYIIGYGASSTVYKCVLKNCKPVAIKKLYSHYPRCLKEFETELSTVGSIKHRNLVSLQGYSLSSSGYLLFYDYMENGSLWDFLHGRKAVDNESNLHHLILSKTANNAVMETVDPEITATCKDLGAVRKVFQLALLCSKKQPTDRPTMHEVTRVLSSLLPTKLASTATAQCTLSSAGGAAKVSGYIDEYANIKTPHIVNCPSMSTSDAQLFVKFGEVISQNSTE
ncbi:hypothetical protein CsatA_028604 [Cannabis sativa]